MKKNRSLYTLLIFLFSLFLTVPAFAADQDKTIIKLNDVINGELGGDVHHHLYTFDVAYKTDLYTVSYLGNSNTLNDKLKDQYVLTLYDADKKVIASSKKTSYYDGSTKTLLYYQALTSQLSKGTYYLSIQDDHSNISDKQAFKIYNNYETFGGAVSVSSLTAKVKSPRPVKSSIQLTAAAKGEYLQYRFSVSANGKSENVIKGFSSSRTVNWKPTKPGTYKVKVQVKNAKSEKVASKAITYKIFSPSKIYMKSITANKKFKAGIKKGTKVTFRTNAKGSYLEYRYRVQQGGKWKTVQNYSSKKSYTWKALKKGTYQIAVDVRQVGTTKYYSKYIKNVKVK